MAGFDTCVAGFGLNVVGLKIEKAVIVASVKVVSGFDDVNLRFQTKCYVIGRDCPAIALFFLIVALSSPSSNRTLLRPQKKAF